MRIGDFERKHDALWLIKGSWLPKTLGSHQHMIRLGETPYYLGCKRAPRVDWGNSGDLNSNCIWFLFVAMWKGKLDNQR